MQNVVLTVHLILAALLIGVVLLQRSEGGGLGIGGGSGGVMTGRQAANALSKATWILAVGFLITSMALFIIAGREAGSGSVLDRIGSGTATAPVEEPSGLPSLPAYVPPPAAGQPVVPPTPAPAAGTAPAATPSDRGSVAVAPPSSGAEPASPPAPAPAASGTVSVPLGDPSSAPAPSSGDRVITVPLQAPPAD